MHVLSSADFFQKSTFSKIYFRNTIRVSNSLDPDQTRRFVGPNLGPNCLQMLSADLTHVTTSNEIVEKPKFEYGNYGKTRRNYKLQNARL